MKRLFLTQMANIMSCGTHRHSIIRSKDLRMYEKFSYILFFYETFIHILLSNICKMKKEKSDCLTFTARVEKSIMKKQTDDLVKRAKRHESEAFTELMQLYMTDMYKVAYAILMNDEDAADAIGDTILICWEKINQLVKIRYFKTWMTRILINKCYDIRKKNQNLICLDEYEEPAACDEYNLELKEALAALDEKYRIIMILFYSEGYRIREISDILKIPESTVKTRLQRGREKLEAYYKEK